MKIEQLRPEHARAAFNSGMPELDVYFRGQAGRDSARRMAAVFVLASKQGLAGYYTLSPATLFLSDLVAAGVRKESRYPPMPVAKLSRLAVDYRHRGKGYGGAMLADALRRVHASPIGTVAVVAEAADEQGQGFYMRKGFLPFPDRPDRFFRPMADIAAML